jgi:hypothetical protein
MPILAFVELSVKYIVTSFAVLWQRVFQAVVCVSSAVHSHTLHSTRYTQQPETHVAPTMQNF